MKLGLMGSIAVVTALMAAPALAEVKLKLAHATPETDLVHTFAQTFADEVNSRTNGEVTVIIYPNGQLGNDQQMLDGVRSGVIDAVVMGSSGVAGIVPEITAFDLPFQFGSRAEAYAALDGPAGNYVFDKMEAFGITGLALPENGFRHMTNARGPINGPKDLEGLRMRVNSSIVLRDTFEALDANPQPLDYAELYTALETGVVDAQDHPLNLLLTAKFYEHQPYLSLTRHAYSPLVSIMNSDSLSELTAEQQQSVMEAAKIATDGQRQIHTDREEEMVAELEGYGIEVTRQVNTKAFQAAVQSVLKKFEEQYGSEITKLIDEGKAQAVN